MVSLGRQGAPPDAGSRDHNRNEVVRRRCGPRVTTTAETPTLIALPKPLSNFRVKGKNEQNSPGRAGRGVAGDRIETIRRLTRKLPRWSTARWRCQVALRSAEQVGRASALFVKRARNRRERLAARALHSVECNPRARAAIDRFQGHEDGCASGRPFPLLASRSARRQQRDSARPFDDGHFKASPHRRDVVLQHLQRDVR